MKILWISNITFGPLCELAGESKSSGGSWLDATFDALAHEKGIELSVVTVSRVKEIRIKKVGNHTFYILPGGYPSEYDYTSSKNKENWERIKAESCPDLIQIWGTEYTHGYLALKVMKGIPSIIYMQGLMSQIERHYLSGISNSDLRKSITIRDILKGDWIERQQLRFYQGALTESKMLQMAGNIIVENEWCESHCKAIAPMSKVYKSKLSIKEEFYGQEWSENKMEPHTIMSNAAGYPIKGLHILLKALSIVLKKYPDTKLLIPGEKSPFEKSFLERLRINGYTKFLIQIIVKLNLKDNICFLDKLTASQMAIQMARSNVFVMPSSIENHSSTLIEAMIVGTPCVSSYVGGIPEYLSHNVNGLLYRFDEHEILAAHIIKIFEDNSFAKLIGSNAKKAMRDSRKAINLKEELLEIYQKVLNP
jgi:glycosyltransferase involved in cell wall biosynthesis